MQQLVPLGLTPQPTVQGLSRPCKEGLLLVHSPSICAGLHAPVLQAAVEQHCWQVAVCLNIAYEGGQALLASSAGHHHGAILAAEIQHLQGARRAQVLGQPSPAGEAL